MTKKLSLFFILFITFSSTYFSQMETCQWRFGKYCALDFLSTPPSQPSNSAINTIEGCASIADASGNLLFYTDATKIWDQTNSIMANGNGLLGNGPYMTTQAAIIIKQPGSQTLYHVFTLAANGGTNGLMYHSVDMSLAAGLGSVTAKNIILHTPSSEKLTAVNHCNGNDVWLITHDLYNGNFRNFLITAAGPSLTPVVSVFPNLDTIYGVGAMKASPDGKHLVLSNLTQTISSPIGGFELYDFDNSTGLVTNRQVLFNVERAYSCEFSPDSKKVYGIYGVFKTVPTSTIISYLLQWDLCDLSPTAIVASQTTLNAISTKQTLQSAPDGKIYIASNGQFTNSLSVIHNPNGLGAASNYSDLALAVTAGTVLSGLPNFNSSFFRNQKNADILWQAAQGTVCLAYNFTASACSSDLADIVSAHWTFGDLNSGSSNTSTLTSPSHVFSSPGTYTLTLIKNYKCNSDTLKKVVQVSATFPAVTITGKNTICQGNSTTLTASGADTYSWSQGATTFSTSLSPTATTVYSLTGTYTATGCSSVTTVFVNVAKCLGVDENENNKAVFVFPNPSKDYLVIQSTKLAKVEVFDILGALLFQSINIDNGSRIDLQNMKSGILLVKVTMPNEKPQFFKVVKE